jgi:hypothetical protein
MAAVVVHEDKLSTKDVWFYCGASGCGGFDSDATLLSTDYLGSGTNLQNAQAYSRLSTRRDGEATTSWRDMAPLATNHGSEITWAYHMRNTWGVAQTAMIVYSQNGTSLVADWVAGAGYSALALTRAQAELALLGSSYVPRGLIVFLAAADATPTNAPQYQTALGTMITAWRAVYPDLSFIIQRPSSLLGGGADVTQIHDAVDAYVATDANSIGMNVDDIPFADNPHYDTPTGYVPLGVRLAKTCAKVLYLPRRGGVVLSG